jgi:hypothetical protein
LQLQLQLQLQLRLTYLSSGANHFSPTTVRAPHYVCLTGQ